MNAQEIRSLIEQKIAGQGTNVDAGGALPTILKETINRTEEALEKSAESKTLLDGLLVYRQFKTGYQSLTIDEFKALIKAGFIIDETNNFYPKVPIIDYRVLEAFFDKFSEVDVVFASAYIESQGQLEGGQLWVIGTDKGGNKALYLYDL